VVQSSHPRFGFGDYVELEETSTVKHEYLGGQVYAMAGGTPEHAGVTANVLRLLGNALHGKPCRVYSPDLRVRVKATGLVSYADASVICGAIELDADDRKSHTALNPTLLVEVLSPSTEDYDRGEKLGHYKQIPSLREVLLIAHDRREVEIVRREPDGSWSRSIAGAGTQARLASIDCALAVDDLYYDPLPAA
jgi:Uma2 family endonuclease